MATARLFISPRKIMPAPESSLAPDSTEMGRESPQSWLGIAALGGAWTAWIMCANRPLSNTNAVCGPTAMDSGRVAAGTATNVDHIKTLF